MYLNAKSDCNFQFLLVMNRNYTARQSNQSPILYRFLSQIWYGSRTVSVYLSIYTGKYLNLNENRRLFLFIIDMEGGRGRTQNWSVSFNQSGNYELKIQLLCFIRLSFELFMLKSVWNLFSSYSNRI